MIKVINNIYNTIIIPHSSLSAPDVKYIVVLLTPFCENTNYSYSTYLTTYPITKYSAIFQKKNNITVSSSVTIILYRLYQNIVSN